MRYLSPETSSRISRIGLGTWQFGSREWGYGQGYAGQEAHAIVRRAVELGVTVFDTAELYGFGRSERILGAAIGPRWWPYRAPPASASWRATWPPPAST